MCKLTLFNIESGLILNFFILCIKAKFEGYNSHFLLSYSLSNIVQKQNLCYTVLSKHFKGEAVKCFFALCSTTEAV